MTFILLQCFFLGMNFYETGSFQLKTEFKLLALSTVTAMIGLMIYQLSQKVRQTY